MTTEQIPIEVADKPKRRKREDPDIAALAKFAKALDAMNDSSRCASIQWLADRYLGIKRLGRMW